MAHSSYSHAVRKLACTQILDGESDGYLQGWMKMVSLSRFHFPLNGLSRFHVPLNGNEYWCDSEELPGPVLLAVIKNDLHALKLALDNPNNLKNINHYNQRFNPPLLEACARGQTEIIKVLLDNTEVDISPRCNWEITPFHVACSNCDLEVIRYFIETILKDEEEIDDEYIFNFVNLNTHKQQTPLHFAAFGKHSREIVPYLLREGACAFLLDDFEKFPCDYCDDVITKRKLEKARDCYLFKYSNVKVTPEILWQHMEVHCLDILRAKRSEQTSPKEKDGNEDEKVDRFRSPLQNATVDHIPGGSIIGPVLLAVMKDDLDALKLALDVPENLKNINCHNLDWNSPLLEACKKGKIEFIKALVGKKEVDIAAHGLWGITPFHAACLKCDLEVVQYLLEEYERVDDKPIFYLVNLFTDQGQTPLHYAAMGQNPGDIVPYLLENGACAFLLDDVKKLPCDYCDNNPNIKSYLQAERDKYLATRGKGHSFLNQELEICADANKNQLLEIARRSIVGYSCYFCRTHFAEQLDCDLHMTICPSTGPKWKSKAINYSRCSCDSCMLHDARVARLSN